MKYYFRSKDGRLGPQYWIVFSIVVAVLALFAGVRDVALGGPPKDGTASVDTPTFVRNPGLKDMASGGTPKDGIPSIDRPMFVSVKEADRHLGEDELIIVVKQGREVRGYPYQILVFHEIVNDQIGSTPVAVTYCPLAGSAIAFDRRVNGKPVEFGVSGRLWNSTLVMYDRATDSYWPQLLGRATYGRLSGTSLRQLWSDTIRWSDFKRAYPNAKVLSRRTGASRRYGRDPYGGYYTSPRLMFPVAKQDSRMHPKARVIGITIGSAAKAYPRGQLKPETTIKDNIGGRQITISVDTHRVINVRDKSGSAVPFKNAFWFAWVATYPHSELYG